LDDRVSRGNDEIFFLTTASTDLMPSQSHIQWVSAALVPGIKRQEREADHSPPSNTEVKNAWSYTSTPNTSLWLGA
jgi:hypothetical protein